MQAESVESKGYQIIEPSSLGMLTACPDKHEFAVAMLQWLVQGLQVELKDQLRGVEISLIRVEYQGAYPALGVRYVNEPNDLGKLIEQTADRLLQERSVSDFAAFLVREKVDWARRTADLMSK
ncbi:hypothetical protein HMI51_22170 [Corallococcus coralloides]|nr:hypothetical protein [Corallococcus coralloides]